MKWLESGNAKLLCYRSFALNFNVAVIRKMQGFTASCTVNHRTLLQKNYYGSKRLTGLRRPPPLGHPTFRSVQTARYSALGAKARTHSRLSSKSYSSTPTCLSQYLPIVLRAASASLRCFAASRPAWGFSIRDICDKRPAFDQMRANELGRPQYWQVLYWHERRSGSGLKGEKT
jgi:hypothetical protein